MSFWKELRSFILAMQPQNPQFEEKHVRGEHGRFAKGGNTVKPASGTPSFWKGDTSGISDDYLRSVYDSFQKEAEDLKTGRRKLYQHDRLGRLITSPVGGKPLALPAIHGLHGEDLEKAFHELLVPPSGVSGFTMTQTTGPGDRAQGSLMSGVPTFMYNYYMTGDRMDRDSGENYIGKNVDHLHDLVSHLEKNGISRGQMSLKRHVGHVKNSGWHSEDHFERVHHPEGIREQQEHALGVERNLQGSLMVHGDENTVKKAAQLASDHARDTGYDWWYPDSRLLHVRDPGEGWTKADQLFVPALGGYLTSIHQGSDEKTMSELEKAVPFARHQQVHMPAGWTDILSPVSADGLDRFKQAANGVKYE